MVGGFNLPLWKMMDFVTWDDDIPYIWKMFQTTNQYVYIYIYVCVVYIHAYIYIYIGFKTKRK